MGRNHSKRVNEASHHSSGNFRDCSYYIVVILEQEVKPAFSRLATSTDLTATKLFSSIRDGLFQPDAARAHTSKASITWLKNNVSLHSKGRLAFARFVSDRKRLEH